MVFFNVDYPSVVKVYLHVRDDGHHCLHHLTIMAIFLKKIFIYFLKVLLMRMEGKNEKREKGREKERKKE